MTGAEWQECEEPDRLMNYFSANPSRRKFRLFTVACCRRIWQVRTARPTASQRTAVDLAERLAEGLATDEDRQRALQAARTQSSTHGIHALYTNMATAVLGVGVLVLGKRP